MARVVLDAGHGGYDNGAVHNGRREKDDNLALTLAVGQILADHGYDVQFTRTEDIYQSPSEKARIANGLGGDLFVSFHRNSSPVPNTYSGVETLIYSFGGLKEEVARAIVEEVPNAGFANLGVKERPNLTVLRRTQMPAVLVEAGFINTDADNVLFDANFEQLAQSIADGIMSVLGPAKEETGNYYVQVGLFREFNNAQNLQNQLMQDGYPSDIIKTGDFYAVITGGLSSYEQARELENALASRGYETLIIIR